MPDYKKLLDAARRQHAAGDLEGARNHYRQVIEADSANVEAWSLLGSALHALGRLDEAEAAFREALRLRPGLAEVGNRLGIIHAQQGRPAEALACFTEAARIQPASASIQNNRASALHDLGRIDEAEAAYRQAIRIKPDYPEALGNLASLLRDRGQPDEAMGLAREAIRLKPEYAAANSVLGNALTDLRRFDESIACFQASLRLDPRLCETHHNLGVALAAERRFEEALAPFQEAIRLRPGYGQAHRHLANVLRELGRLDEAGDSCRRALAILPRDAESHNALGVIHFEYGRYDEALACYETALAIDPDHRDARRNRGLLRMLLGDPHWGEIAYDASWANQNAKDRSLAQPLWDGTALNGRRILLYSDQGLGDTLQFVRYAPLVKQRGGTVIVACHTSLLGLLASCPGVDRVIDQMEMGSNSRLFDVQAPLTGLPTILGNWGDTVPNDVPYLAAEPGLAEYWRTELGALPGFKIGIAWQGNPKHYRDRIRSYRLSDLAPLAKLPGVLLVSLQKGYGSEQAGAVAGRWPLLDLNGRADSNARGFLDTAAVVQNLDMVVAPDSSVAHLAGALGKPVAIALPFVPDWRWLLDRSDSPWYPSARLFRQSRRGEWGEVFERIASEARRSIEGRRR